MMQEFKIKKLAECSSIQRAGDKACRHNFGESMSIGIIAKNREKLELKICR